MHGSDAEVFAEPRAELTDGTSQAQTCTNWTSWTRGGWREVDRPDNSRIFSQALVYTISIYCCSNGRMYGEGTCHER
jgi:hypothetical protein